MAADDEKSMTPFALQDVHDDDVRMRLAKVTRIIAGSAEQIIWALKTRAEEHPGQSITVLLYRDSVWSNTAAAAARLREQFNFEFIHNDGGVAAHHIWIMIDGFRIYEVSIDLFKMQGDPDKELDAELDDTHTPDSGLPPTNAPGGSA